MAPSTRAAASRKRTDHNDIPTVSNKRRRTIRSECQPSEPTVQEATVDRATSTMENTQNMNIELEELRDFKRQAEIKELEMTRDLEALQEVKRLQAAEMRSWKNAYEEARNYAHDRSAESTKLREQVEAYKIAEQSRGENRERLEELEEEHEEIEDLGGLDKICKDLERFEELGDIEDLQALHYQLDEFGGIEKFREDFQQLEELGGLDEILETYDQLEYLGGLEQIHEEREYDKERIEDLELECERLGEVDQHLRAVEAQRDCAQLERNVSREIQRTIIDATSPAFHKRDEAIAALREELRSERQALYELRMSCPVLPQESEDEDQPEPNSHTDTGLAPIWLASVCEVAKANIKKQMTKAPLSAKKKPSQWFHIGTCPTQEVFCQIFRLATPKKSFKITAKELDRALGGPVENFSIAAGPLALIGEVNVYWDPKTLTLKMSGTFGQSLATQYDDDDMRYPYVDEYGEFVYY